MSQMFADGMGSRKLLGLQKILDRRLLLPSPHPWLWNEGDTSTTDNSELHCLKDEATSLWPQ